ncbi:MAG: DUF3899 domain-containing protein [Bacilli bacterium]|nr:DUF3899 domain-containing protein [Bacilli bacterium]MDD4077733.1 DUF3899 domain-containing protein [Bacilli bacterium]MDD4388444.1 DUF3899 domain-containing protein [Bacilli bacterium]
MKKWLVPNIVAVLIFIFIILLSVKKNLPYQGGMFVDAFMITGFFLWMGAGIIYIDQEGVFNIISYGVKKLFRVFKKDKSDDFPETYFEYNELRGTRKPIKIYPFLIVGTIYFLVGLLIYLI